MKKIRLVPANDLYDPTWKVPDAIGGVVPMYAGKDLSQRIF